MFILYLLFFITLTVLPVVIVFWTKMLITSFLQESYIEFGINTFTLLFMFLCYCVIVKISFTFLYDTCIKRRRRGPVPEIPEPATYLTIPPTPQINSLDHGIIFPSALHIDPQISPPPYSAVALPPSYDEAIKQTSEETRATLANSSTEENKY